MAIRKLQFFFKNKIRPFLVAMISVAIAIFILEYILPPTTLELSLIYSSPVDGRIEWIQNQRAIVHDLKAGEQVSAQIGNMPGPFEVLRIDPTFPIGTVFRLHKIKIQEIHSGASQEVPLEGSTRVSLFGLEKKSESEFKVVHDDPHLEFEGKFPSQTSSSLIGILQATRDGTTGFKALSVLLMLTSLNYLFKRRWYLVSVAGGMLLFSPIALISQKYFFSNPQFNSTDMVISWASYSGYAKVSERYGYLALLLFFILLGMVTSLRSSSQFVVGSQPTHKIQRKWLLLFVLATAYLLLPNYLKIVDFVNNLKHPTYWDYLNNHTWSWAKYEGWRPLKDFWYPYAGQIYFSKPLITESVLIWLHSVWIFFMLIYSFLKMDSSIRLRMLLLLLGLIFAMQWAWIAQAARYLFFPASLLFMTSFLNERSWSHLNRAAFGLTWGWLLFFESNAAIYVGVPLLICFVFEFIFRKKQRLNFLRQWIVNFGVLIFVTTIYLFYLKMEGQLTGWLEIYSQIKGLTANSALATDFRRWITEPDQLDGWIIFSICLGLCIGPHFFMSNLANQFRRYSVFAISLCFALIYLKHLSRPHMTTQLANGAALIWICIFLSIGSRLLTYLALSIVAFGFYKSGIDIRWLQVFNGERIAAFQSWSSYSFEQAERIKSNYFDKSKYELPPGMTQNFFEKIKVLSKHEEIYSLGDFNFIYILLDQKPFYFLTYYDGGLLSYQRKTLDELQTRNPKYVFWDQRTTAVDDVPIQLRYALIFPFLKANYQYLMSEGPYHVLVRRSTEQPIDWKYWQQVLGSEIDLKCLPFLNQVKFTGKLPQASSDATILSISRAILAKGIELDAPFGKFRVFSSCEFGERGMVRLDRLWSYPEIKISPSAKEEVLAIKQGDFSEILY